MRKNLDNVTPVSFINTRLREMMDECKTHYGLSLEQTEDAFVEAMKDFAQRRGWKLRVEIERAGRRSITTA